MWGVVYLAETLEGASLLRTLIGGGRTRALIRDEDQLRARIPDLLARLVACRHLLASVVADEHGASLRDRLVAELDRALGPGVYEPEEGLEELIDHLVDLRHQTDEVPSPILETGSLEPRIYRPHPFVARADILASLLGATTVHGRVLDQALKSYDEVATFFGE